MILKRFEKMKDKEINSLVRTLEKLRKKLEESKKDSEDLLIDAGIITKKGILKENYKHLCIPREQV